MFNLLVVTDSFDTVIKGQSYHYKLLSSTFYKSPWFGFATFVISCTTVVLGLSKFLMQSKLKLFKEISICGCLGILVLNAGFILRIAYINFVTKQWLERVWLQHNGWKVRYITLYNVPYIHLQLPLQLMCGAIPVCLHLIVLLYTGGMKRTWKLIIMYPQVILSGAFTPFLFRHVNKDTNNDLCKCDIKYGFIKSCFGDKKNGTDNFHMTSESTSHSGFQLWKLGSFLNAAYIIAFPGILIPIVDYNFGIIILPTAYIRYRINTTVPPILIYMIIAGFILLGSCCIPCRSGCKCSICSVKCCLWPCSDPQILNVDKPSSFKNHITSK